MILPWMTFHGWSAIIVLLLLSVQWMPASGRRKIKGRRPKSSYAKPPVPPTTTAKPNWSPGDFLPPGETTLQPPNSLPLCTTTSPDEECLLPGPKPLPWNEAHQYCRAQNGFLLDRREYHQLKALPWPPQNLPLLKKNLTSAGTLTSGNMVDKTTTNFTWTTITRHGGRFQFLSKFPAVAQFTPWSDIPEEWLSECAAIDRHSLEYTPLSCSEPLQFYCKRIQQTMSLQDLDFGDMELRVESSVQGKDGWVEVDEREFDDLDLTCTAYQVSTGRPLQHQPPVFWSKDNIYLDFHENKIIPAIVHDPTKSYLTNLEQDGEILRTLKQGTFWCEAWKPLSTERLVSNKFLLTLKTWIVLILSIGRLHSLGVSVDNTIRDLQCSFRSHLPDIDKYVFDAIYAEKREILSGGNMFVNYIFQVHIPKVNGSFERVRNLLEEKVIDNVYKESRHLVSSSASLPTFCLEHTEIYDHGNEVKWPFTQVGKVNPEHFRCEIPVNKLKPGHCRWNYTHGAWIDFDSSECQRFDFCPRGYTGIANHFCTLITVPDTWDTGFRNLYETGYEEGIMDSTKFHRQESGQLSIYAHIKAMVATKTDVNQVWLRLRRKANRGPLVYMGPNKSDILFSRYKGPSVFNIVWAQDHPKSDKECVALDIANDHLLTLDCNTLLPFIFVTDISNLHKLPNQNWKLSFPNLITDSSACGQDWSTTGFRSNRYKNICFKMFMNIGNYTWNDAKEFCEQRNSQFPTPGVGYLDWVYKQYLMNNNVSDVWMTYQQSPTKFQDKFIDMDKVNWIAETDYAFEYSAFSTDGWLLEDDKTLKTNILCQREILHRDHPSIEFHSSGYEANKAMCININYDNFIELGHVTPLNCFVNGKYEPIDHFFFKENCHLAINGTKQGYYQCYTWMMLSPTFIESPKLLKRNPKALTFAVSLIQDKNYLPKDHDSTFSLMQNNPKPCQDAFIKRLETQLRSLSIPEMSVTVNNFFFSPELHSNKLLQNFHIQLKMEDDMKITEGNLFDIMSEFFKGSENFSDCTFFSIRSTVGCMRDITEDNMTRTRNLTWPETKGRAIVLSEELCITDSGEPVTRECIGDFVEGYQWDHPTGSCLGEPTSTTTKLWEISKSGSGLDRKVVRTLSDLTANGSSLMPVDIHLIAREFQTISAGDALHDLDLEDVVEILNNILQANDKDFEPVQRRLNSSSILFEAFENITFKVKLPKGDGDKRLKASRNLVSVERLDLEFNSTIIGFQSQEGGRKQKEILMKGLNINNLDGETAIIFPENLTHIVATDSGKLSKIRYDKKEKVPLTFVVYRTSKLFQDNETFPNYSITNHIIQASYNGRTVWNLKEPIKLLFKSSVPRRNDSKCVYWNFGKYSGRGGWSTEGCWKGNHLGNYDVCLCNHLTSFAYLMNYDDTKIDKTHEFVLSIITIIGCTLSIIGLLLVFATFILFKKWRRPLSNKILFNLSLSIFCSLVIFLAGINQTWNIIFCRSIAVALHYFILASFGWMLVEAVHQYLKFVKIIGTYIPRFLWKASVCAWGIPVLPIIAVLVYDSTMYDSGYEYKPETKICWMSSEGFKYAFLPPLALTMSINLVMYSLILYGAICGRRHVDSTLSERTLHVSQFIMAVCIFFLLGFTWIFGMLAIGNAKPLFSYLFCIFNTLQGFFIFILHVFREQSARKLWRHFLGVLSRSPTSNVSSQNVNSLQGKGDSVTFNQEGRVYLFS